MDRARRSEPGSRAKAETAAFGEGILAPDRTIDRKKLGPLVFADPNALKRLNAIVHPKMFQRMRATVRDESGDMEFQSEVEEHVRLLADRYRRQGMTADAAILAARRQFGNTALLAEDQRAIRTIPTIDAVRADLAYAARTLRKNPGFAAAAVATMALGIGANTAIFSLCNAVLFKPLPYAEPNRIMMLWERQSNGKLSTVAPANGAVGVAVTTAVVVTFNEAVNAATVNNATVRVAARAQP